MSSAITDHPTVKALQDAFGADLRVMGDGGPDPKNCILLREVKIFQGRGTERRLVKDQLIVQVLNHEGKPINPHKAQWGSNVASKLVSVMPELGAQLTGGEGTHRAQKLRSIVPSVAGNPNMHALESLTPNVPLTGDPKASDFSAKNTRALPTMITWIDATNQEEPRRIIVLIEQNVGDLESSGKTTNRVDMATISYKMGDSEIAAFRDGDGWKKGFSSDNLRPNVVEGTDVKIKNVDPNRYITGKKAVEHHKKTIKSTLGCLKFLNEEFGLKPLGEVQMRMIDILQNPLEFRAERHVDTGQISARTAVRAPEVDSGEMRTVSTAKVVCEYDDRTHKMTGVKRISSDLVKVFKKINAHGIREIQEELARLHRFVGRVAPKRYVTRLRRR
jgi:hypothetical protein